MKSNPHIWHLEPRAVYNTLMKDLLSQREMSRANAFRFEKDQLCFIACRAALRQILGTHFACDPKQLQINLDFYGKPYLENNPVYFNISHSGDRALIAIHESSPIGVDIELVQSLPDATQIAQRFFSQSEYEEYQSLSEEEKPRGFFHCWTRKEAFIKAIGQGLSYPLKDFDVSLSKNSKPLLQRHNEDESWHAHNITVSDNYLAAAVYQSPTLPQVSTFAPRAL